MKAGPGQGHDAKMGKGGVVVRGGSRVPLAPVASGTTDAHFFQTHAESTGRELKALEPNLVEDAMYWDNHERTAEVPERSLDAKPNPERVMARQLSKLLFSAARSLFDCAAL